MIALQAVFARGRAERGRPRPVLTNVNLEHRSGVLAILGATKDGTSLLLDLLDGSAAPKAGRVFVLGTTPEAARGRVSRVSFDAPLPEALSVDAVCDLAAKLRGEAPIAASDRLGALGLGALAQRRVGSLSVDERRAVALALAVTSTKTEVILVDEPLIGLDPVAPRLVVDVLRRRAESACVVVTTASARDGARLADRLAVLTSGVLTPLPPASELPAMAVVSQGSVSIRVVVSAASGKRGAAEIAGVLAADEAVVRVETTPFEAAGADVAHSVSAWGRDFAQLAWAVTRAVAAAGVDVDRIEPATPSLEAIRAALATRDASPPPGSLPPRSVPVPPIDPGAGGPPG